MDATETVVREIISNVGDVPLDRVTKEADLASLGVDSLMALSIIAKVEKRFKVQIPEQQLRGIRTVKQIIALLEKSGAQVPS